MTTTIYLMLYLLLSCSVTYLNKFILHAPYPYLLTASHASATSITCSLIRRNKHKAPVDRQLRLKLLCFSFLYTINISISNASLGLVTLPVHQAIRATSPVLTVLLASVLPTQMSVRSNWTTNVTLLPIVAGALLATYGERYDASCRGFLLTLIGAVLAVVKTIATNVLVHKSDSSVPPIELLSILSPLAAAQALLWAIWTGEISGVMKSTLGSKWVVILVLDTAMAAALNIASFEANRRGGPLAMAIAANVKQVLLLAVPLGGKLPGPTVVCGTALTVVGSVRYAHVQSRNRRDLEPTVARMLPHHHHDGNLS